jgi:hypothetical protein
MAIVITFSRTFPSYHPKHGQPTHFVEKVIKSLPYSLHDESAWGNLELCKKLDLAIDIWKDIPKKHHTIRAGNRWKVGDWFSPRVWSGKPYASKMIQFAPDVQIKKLWDFEMMEDGCIHINGELYAYPNSDFALQPLAENDGLEWVDLLNWFQEPFKGQIICWNEDVTY